MYYERIDCMRLMARGPYMARKLADSGEVHKPRHVGGKGRHTCLVYSREVHCILNLCTTMPVLGWTEFTVYLEI